ncbi:MAG: orotate phosphoribosyltransferase [Flavobacteriaceae bacterium]|nr:orotate phosphoribosyltransferase [Flavobacteriaceae bacterium]
MICNKDTAKKTAKLLLKIKAVKLQPNDPFTWASGWKSPIYCDNRITLSHPDVRKFIQENFTSQIKSDFPDVEVIAGVATGAIAIGVLVADALGLPFVYVRPEPKSHGRKNQIEGALNPGQKVVVIEDLISTGMSSMNAILALREAGAEIQGMLAIFSYGFEKAEQLFTSEKVSLKTLSNYEVLIEEAISEGYIENQSLELLKKWREKPDQYGN